MLKARESLNFAKWLIWQLRMGVDKNIGKFTCHIYNGASTIDCYLCSAPLFALFCEFKVHDINKFSDYCPVEAHLKLSHNPRCSTVSKVAEKLLWDEQKKGIFLQNQCGEEISVKCSPSMMSPVNVLLWWTMLWQRSRLEYGQPLIHYSWDSLK